jgi:hypothetical protein
MVLPALHSSAMGMPQKEAHENHILEMMEGKGTSHSCYSGVANLIQFTTGRVNELWNVVKLVPLTFFLEPISTPVDNHIPSTVH